MPRANYSFVDNIRCIAMIAIVIEHTSFLGSYIYSREASPYWTYLTELQLVKFGTIAFFIIAGFLFAENSGNYAFFDYLKRRFDNIFKPWLIWSVFFFLLITSAGVSTALQQGVSFRGVISCIAWGFKTVYLYSNYWFIVNFFFCTIVLLLSKRIIRSWIFGLCLLLTTSFYSLNIYAEWIAPQHTTALLGFVFFYWLGAQLNFNYKTVQTRIDRIPRLWFVLVALATLTVAVLEASYLSDLKKVDPINTLRFSNILFSLSVFFLLFKIKNFSWVSSLQPRKTTYGVFLVHYILVYYFLPFLLGEINIDAIRTYTIADLFIYQLSRIIIGYVSSFALVTMLCNSNLSWIIGLKTISTQDVPESEAIQREIQSPLLETEAA